MASDATLETRLPPNDRRAERDLLGSVLRDPITFADAAQELVAEDFYADAHQRIWRVVAWLVENGKPIDVVLVADELQHRGWSADVGGAAYLADLWDAAPSITNAVHYAVIVRDKKKLRMVIQTANDMLRQAWELGVEADDIVARAGELIFDLALDRKTKTVDWQAAVNEALEVIDRRSGKAKDGQTEEGLQTGWTKLDRLTGGLQKRELVILAARPSAGKTLAVTNIIDAVASNGGRVYFATLEQGTSDIVHRMLSKRGEVNSYRFRTGQFDAESEKKLLDAVDSMKGFKVWINPASGQSLTQVVSESRRLKMRHGLDLVVVDYLGLMGNERGYRSGTRTEEIGRLTRGLKCLAKDLGIVVICLSQLSRDVEKRGGKPRLSDLRDSGEIEQDADTVFMLHKPEEKDDSRNIDELLWLVEKQRNGPCGEISMQHYKRFFDIREKQ